MIEKLTESSGPAIGYRLSGTIGKPDYDVMVPEMESLIAQYGSAQVLCDLTDFKWESVSAWRADIQFGHEFHDKITKMAIVGDHKWEKLIADMAEPFYARDARFFADQTAAWAWLRE